MYMGIGGERVFYPYLSFDIIIAIGRFSARELPNIVIFYT